MKLWLILCVILAGVWYPEIWLNITMDFSVKFLWMKLVITLHVGVWVSFIQSVEDLNTKRPTAQEEEILPTDASDENCNSSVLPHQVFDLSNLHNHMSQFLQVSQYIHIRLVASLENPNTGTKHFLVSTIHYTLKVSLLKTFYVDGTIHGAYPKTEKRFYLIYIQVGKCYNIDEKMILG